MSEQGSHAFPPAAELQSVYKYDPASGRITKNGWCALSIRAKDSKRLVRHKGRALMAARVAFCIHTGEEIGHRNVELIDGKPWNLKWDNFRVVCPYEQQKLRARQKADTQGGIKDTAIGKRLPDVSHLFLYDPTTGVLRWALKPGNPVISHPRVRIGRKVYMVHRVIWKLHHGEDPLHLRVVPKNGDCQDNRADNLRLATRSEIVKRSPRNTSGVKGVSWIKSTQKWQASITHNKVIIGLGSHENLEDAKAIVMEYREKLHKAFARHE